MRRRDHPAPSICFAAMQHNRYLVPIVARVKQDVAMHKCSRGMDNTLESKIKLMPPSPGINQLSPLQRRGAHRMIRMRLG
jgi:hypothetical protein